MKTVNRLSIAIGTVALGTIAIGALVFHNDIVLISGGILFAAVVIGKVLLAIGEK